MEDLLKPSDYSDVIIKRQPDHFRKVDNGMAISDQ